MVIYYNLCNVYPYFNPGIKVMANTSQTRKRSRQTIKKNKRNSSFRSMLRTAIKRVYLSIKIGNKDKVNELLQSTISIIDRIANKNIIHKNKAARYKSRLAASVKAMI